MKYIPMNCYVNRTDKRTYVFSSGYVHTVVTAQLMRLRREAIDDFMIPTSSAAGDIYVAHMFQKPIRDALKNWWHDEVASAMCCGQL